MKVKIGEIINVYPVVMKASFAKMSGKAKLQMVHIIKALKPYFDGFTSLREEAIKKFADDDYKAAIEKVNKSSDYPKGEVDDALKIVRTSDEAFARFVTEETEKEVEIEIERLSEDDFATLLEGSKDLTPNELVMLSELIEL